MVGLEQAIVALDILNNEMLEAVDDSIDDLLTFVDNAQAKRYTQDSDPAKPPLSRYERTFDLQNSTEKVHAVKFQGEWIADIEYAEYVLGPQGEQAPIHRGRWKSREVVEEETSIAAPSIIIENIERRFP